MGYYWLSGGVIALAAALYGLIPLWRLKKQPKIARVASIEIDADAAVRRLGRAISCETTGRVEEDTGNHEAFRRLQAQFAADYPRVFSAVEIYHEKPFHRLYRWRGQDEGRKPILLMAHQDVVPVTPGTEGDWRYPPFSGTVAEGCVWGRGAIDMKNALCGIFEAMEHLIGSGFVPNRDVYFCTTCDEEIMGEGSMRMATLCKELGLHFEFVLDEGGSFMDGEALGAQGTLLACLCTYEKGYCDVRLSASGEGGSAAYPVEDNPLARVARALAAIEDNQFPIDANESFIDLYRTIAPYCDLRTRWMAAHPRRYARTLAQRLAERGPYGNALVRTTTAVTQIGGSGTADTVARRAWGNVNFRLNPGLNYEALTVFIKEQVGPKIEVTLPIKSNPTRPARVDTPAYAAIAASIRETFGEDVVVAPMAFFAGTDSRMFDIVADDVYKFMPARSHMRYASGMHGTNERIEVEDYLDGIRFYIRLLQKTCGTKEGRA
jgi:carboxypeptidase PM20D1